VQESVADLTSVLDVERCALDVFCLLSSIYVRGLCDRRLPPEPWERKRTARTRAQSRADSAQRKACDRSQASDHARARRHDHRSVGMEIARGNRCRASKSQCARECGKSFLRSAIAFRSKRCRKQKKCSLGSSLSPISSGSPRSSRSCQSPSAFSKASLVGLSA